MGYPLKKRPVNGGADADRPTNGFDKEAKESSAVDSSSSPAVTGDAVDLHKSAVESLALHSALRQYQAQRVSENEASTALLSLFSSGLSSQSEDSQSSTSASTLSESSTFDDENTPAIHSPTEKEATKHNQGDLSPLALAPVEEENDQDEGEEQALSRPLAPSPVEEEKDQDERGEQREDLGGLASPYASDAAKENATGVHRVHQENTYEDCSEEDSAPAALTTGGYLDDVIRQLNAEHEAARNVPLVDPNLTDGRIELNLGFFSQLESSSSSSVSNDKKDEKGKEVRFAEYVEVANYHSSDDEHDLATPVAENSYIESDSDSSSTSSTRTSSPPSSSCSEDSLFLPSLLMDTIASCNTEQEEKSEAPMVLPEAGMDLGMGFFSRMGSSTPTTDNLQDHQDDRREDLRRPGGSKRRRTTADEPQPTPLSFLYSWAPVLEEQQQNQLEFGLPITLPCMSWLFGYSWFGVFMCWAVVIVHTFESLVTDFGPKTSAYRLRTWIGTNTHHIMDCFLIGGLATLHLFSKPGSDFGEHPIALGIALWSTIPPYLAISYHTMFVKEWRAKKEKGEQKRLLPTSSDANNAIHITVGKKTD